MTTLTSRYRRWFDYEKDSHRSTLDSLKAVSEEQRESEGFRKAVYLMGHIVDFVFWAREPVDKRGL